MNRQGLTRFVRNIFVRVRAPFLGLLLSVALCTGMLVLLHENPAVLWEAFYNTLFTGFGLGHTLFYSTPLIFTGISVAICFQCGLFNIGAEGQLYMGAVAVVAAATLFSGLPPGLAIPVAILASVLGGGLWGGLAGFLKAKRGNHEVIVTILLNFISYAFVGWMILYPLKNSTTQNPQTLDVPNAYLIPTFQDLGLEYFKNTPVNVALGLAILVAVGSYFFLYRTVWGFELRAVGKSSRASQFAGISVTRNSILAFFLAGASAGLVGINEICGYQKHLVEGFSPQYGFTGIAVALLARSHPIGVLLSAFLFGALQNSARELEFLSERVTKELAMVLQGILIAFIAADYLIEKWLNRPAKQEREGKS